MAIIAKNIIMFKISFIIINYTTPLYTNVPVSNFEYLVTSKQNYVEQLYFKSNYRST